MKIKKYNNENEVWREYSSTHANGIYTEVPELLHEEENIISVETGLERLSNDIKILKGNVAWLAKNGGGGSGSGGSGSSEAQATITVNGQPTGSTVILDDNGLIIHFEIKGIFSKSWNVSISIGAQRIYSGTVSLGSPNIILTRNNISKYLSNYKGNLNISASYIDDLNGVYGSSVWTGSIVESSVFLESQDTSSSLENINTSYITIDYAVGFLGNTSQNNYLLKINVSKEGTLLNTYSLDLSIKDNNKRSRQVYASEFIPENNLEIGIYNLEISLKNLENPEIQETIYSNFTIASLNAIFISSKDLSEDLNSPTEYPVNGYLLIKFIAYLLNYRTFLYTIKVNDNEIIKTGTGEFEKQIEVLLSLVEKSWAEENEIVKITLIVEGGGLTESKDFYIKIVSSTSSYLETPDKDNLMYEFRADSKNQNDYDLSYTNNNFTYGDTTHNLNVITDRINQNNLSVVNIALDGTPYLRISNGAGYVIKNWNFSNRSLKFDEFFPEDSINNFTISLCFKADYHADDFRTILFCGTIDNTTGKISTGISIDVHDIYINNKSVYKLTDNIINIVDITCEYYAEETVDTNNQTINTIYYIIKLYIDGVLTFVEKINKSSFLKLGKEIYLGCQHHSIEGNDIYTQFTDCNIYNLRIYNTVLTPYEIMINRANSLAATNYINGLPQYSLIDAELQYNFCSRNARESDGIQSQLYDKITKNYNIGFLFDGNYKLNQDALSAAQNIGIPIMYIDVSSNSDWTFDNFVTQQSSSEMSLGEVVSIPILYWDPGKTNQSILTINNCSVELQGTSTLADVVKNLNITFLDSTVFIPKDTWLPEKTYTLKADVVDSSHSNNAAIGTFINDTLGEYLPVDPQARLNIENSNYVRNQQPTATLKHTVEGFPIFLIMKFNVVTEDLVGITPLGIYSFNLGRDAIHNLGFNKINNITQNGQLILIDLFPFLAENVLINATNESANWIETRATNSVADLSRITGTTFPENFNSSRGDFWQNDDNILNNLFEVRFPDNRRPSEYINFKRFVNYIIKLPIESISVTASNGDVIRNDVYGRYDKYSCNVEGTNYLLLDGSYNEIASDPNSYESNTPFNLESYRKYFVIAMLLGLVDNFGKNMVHKSWENGQYYAGFYDLDSALGGSNLGELNISYTLWLKYLYNKPGSDDMLRYAAETYDRNVAEENSVVAASGNKLWLSLDTSVHRSVLGRQDIKSLYTESWYDLRIKLNELAFNEGYDSFVDYFIDKFYINQTKNCGSLLFNYDYKLKYLLLFKDEKYNLDKSLSKLHGRKIAYTRNWLEKRILFLDSLFHWRDVNLVLSFKNDVNNRGANTVRITPKVFPLTFNNSLLIYNSIGDTFKSYYFAKENEEVLVDSANSASNSILNWNISNSSNLIQFGNDEIKLKDLNVALLSHHVNNNSINYVGYPSITILDLSETKTLGNFSLSSFTPNGVGNYKRNAVSEIRVLDFSNTSGDQQFTLNLTENTTSGDITRFQKLQEINIEGSKCISDLIIPEIPLLKLSVRGSNILTFNLRNQAYLPEVDLSNCTRLLKINISGCSGYRNFSISYLSNLEECIITDCSQIETITITNCSKLSKIFIELCPNLQSIVINNCKSLTNLLTIYKCSNLETLSLESCSELTNFVITDSNVENITTLDVSKTKLQYITEGQYTNDTLLDLRNFLSLNNFKISSDEEIEEILFANILDNPIELTNNFSSCTNLKRVYGNICLKTNSIFKGLKRFSILGTITSFLGHNIKDSNNIVLLPRDLVGNENYFLSGDKVTNIVVDTTNLTSCFEMTNCTLFDVYYLLEKAGSKVTNITNIFKDLVSDPFTWLNSPHRRMFEKNTNLTTLTGAFYGGRNAIRLYSPTINSNNEYNDDGIFSPLIRNTLISLMTVFYGRRLFIDRHLFRVSDENKTISVDSLSYFNVDLIVDDVNSLPNTLIDVTTQYIENNWEQLGNLRDFFSQISSINNSYSFMSSVTIINYDTLEDIPLTSITTGLNCSYGFGTLNTETLFRNKSAVTNITSSFRVSHKLEVLSNNIVLQVNFNINNNTLSGFTSLKYLGNICSGYNNNNGGYSINSFKSASFTGYGYNKYINEMPYDLLKDCTNLVLFNGFFRECHFNNQSESVELPGMLFKYNTKLEVCSGTFSNIDFLYAIVGNGFLNCNNLKDVSYLFSYDTKDSGDRDALYNQGSIPNRLFYHGINNQVNKTIYGIVGNVTSTNYPEYVEYIIEPENGTSYWCKVYNNGNVEWDTSVNSHYEQDNVVYTIYNNNIINMEGCFYHNNIEYYTNTTPSIENNPDYMPFDWVFENNLWKNVTKDLYREIIYWEYDGVSDPYNGEYKNLDELQPSYSYYMYNIKTNNVEGTQHYICSPDLLRYSKNNCNVTYLFANCGHDSLDSTYGQDSTRNFISGLKGRIVPYLLLPLKNCLNVNLNYMFYNCKLLSSYVKNGRSYLIPEDFFKYCPNVLSMLYSFAGLIFNYNIQLDVFANNISPLKLLNISNIFFRTYYANTSLSNTANISSVFITFKSLNNTTRAFANSDSINGSDIRQRDIYVTFSNIFPSGVYTKESYLYNTNFKETFAYFGNAGLITHESPKTLPDNSTTNNYTMHN